MIFPFENVIDVVGWTLIHLLWQAPLIYGALAVARALAGLAHPSLRYALSCAALGAVVAAAAITATRVAGPGQTTSVTQNVSSKSSASVGTSVTNSGAMVVDRRGGLRYAPIERPSVFERASEAAEPYLPSLVAAWVFGVLIISGRQVGSVVSVHRLLSKASRIKEPDLSRFRSLADAIRLNRAVRFLEIDASIGPFATGWLKPAVVLPIGIFNHCSVAEIDAIVTHELAHLRRFDRLIDLLQVVLETLLFCNPGFWAICQALENDRELCADRPAIPLAGGSRAYGELLLRLQANHQILLRPQAGFLGRGGGILERIRALGVHQRKRHRGLTEAGMSIGLATLCVFVIGAKAADAVTQLQTRRDLAKTPEWQFVPDLIGSKTFSSVAFDAAYRSALSAAGALAPIDDPRYARLLEVAQRGVDIELAWRAFLPLISQTRFPRSPREFPSDWPYQAAPTHDILVARLWKLTKRIENDKERHAATIAVLTIGSMRRESAAAPCLRPIITDPKFAELSGLSVVQVEELRRYWATAHDALSLAVREVMERYTKRTADDRPLRACGERIPDLLFVSRFLAAQATEGNTLSGAGERPAIVDAFTPRLMSR